MNLAKFIQERLLRAEEQNQQLDVKLTTNSVLLRKRLCEWTSEDMFSVFNRNGVYKRIDDRGLRSMNIIQPSVQATAAAIITADVKVTIEPRFIKDSKTEMAAQVCAAIKDLKTQEQWTSQLHEQIATEPQIAPGVFLKVEWNPYAKKTYTIDEWGEDEFDVGGKAVCKSCGAEMEGVMDAETIPCEHCGGEAEVIEPPEKQKIDVVKDSKSYKAGDTRTTVVPAAEILIDPMGTQGGNLKAAKWMIHRKLVPLGEMKAEYPECPGSSPWSMPLKWQHAINSGQSEPRDVPTDLVERKDFYLTPEVYDLEPVEEEVHLKDGKESRFFVKEGQKLSEGLFNGKPFEEPPVLCVRTVSNQIIDIFPCDFREDFIYIAMNSNPSMFWGLFLTKLLPLQDIVNQMLTIQVRHTSRNARTTKILNSLAFDPEDAEKDVVLTKQDIPLDSNVNNTFGMIPAATLSSAPMELIGTIMSLRGEVSGVTPAMQGQAQPNEPYAAQRQQKEQSLGQLTPFLRSIALGKVAWTLRQLKECQENWSEEDFNFLLKLNGEWDEEYIEAFLKCNLDTDVIIDYEQGSESPRNLLDRELALRQFMNDVMGLAQLNPAIAKPELIDEILLRIKQFTQVDVDVSNTEAEMRLADARYDKIVSLIDGMVLPPDTDPQVLKVMAVTLVQVPDLMPSQYEDAGTEVEFYRDKITQELSQDKPNFLLVACLEAQIQSHMQAAVETAQQAAQAEMAAQQPMVDQQNAMAQEQAAQEQQAQAQQMQMQQAQAEQQMANEQESRKQEMDFEREKMAMAREDKMMDATIAAASREHEAKLKPKEKK